MPAAGDLLAFATLVLLLGAITIIDVRSRRIPNALTFALVATGIAAAALPGNIGMLAATTGALAGGLGSLAVALGFRWWRGIDGLGMGDVKFLAGAGAWTGWEGIGAVLFVASTTALLTVAALALVRRAPGRREAFAFGPYLCFALLAVRVLQIWPAFA